MENGHVDVVRLLLDHGPLSRRNINEATALHDAVFWDNAAMVNLLLDKGADVNERGKNGSTALFQAKDEAMVTLLLKRGAELSVVDADGDTPLANVAGHGYLSSVRCLLEHGADAASQSKSGETPLSHAEKRGHAEVAALLRQHTHGW